MIQKGVNAYLPKDTDIDNILFTVEKVHTEGYYFSENVTKHIIPGICKNNIDDASGGPLNLREREILELLCNGLTNKEVSDKLHISEDGVAFHRRNLNKKADAKSFADLVKYAIRNGITTL
jgi:two-component system NarL family response regulator